MLKVFVTHPCTPPNMLLGTEEVEFTRTGLFKRTVHTRTVYNYSSVTAKWDCPVCASEWYYSNHYSNRDNGTIQNKGDADYGWCCMKRNKITQEIDENVTEISSLGS